MKKTFKMFRYANPYDFEPILKEMKMINVPSTDRHRLPVFTNLCLMGSRCVMPIGQGQLPYACPFPLLPFVITQGT